MTVEIECIYKIQAIIFSLFQAANIGVGICGNEGLQAASASDYSIGRFYFLKRLLFIHGAWNFQRTAKACFFKPRGQYF